MKVGAIFDHPTRDGGVVRLKAVSDDYPVDSCEECYFHLICSYGSDPFYDCMVDDCHFIVDNSNKLHRIMDAIRHRTGIHDLEVLESEIKTILEG